MIKSKGGVRTRSHPSFAPVVSMTLTRPRNMRCAHIAEDSGLEGRVMTLKFIV